MSYTSVIVVLFFPPLQYLTVSLTNLVTRICPIYIITAKNESLKLQYEVDVFVLYDSVSFFLFLTISNCDKAKVVFRLFD